MTATGLSDTRSGGDAILESRRHAMFRCGARGGGKVGLWPKHLVRIEAWPCTRALVEEIRKTGRCVVVVVVVVVLVEASQSSEVGLLSGETIALLRLGFHSMRGGWSLEGSRWIHNKASDVMWWGQR